MKTKELDPIGGFTLAVPPGSANVLEHEWKNKSTRNYSPLLTKMEVKEEHRWRGAVEYLDTKALVGCIQYHILLNSLQLFTSIKLNIINVADYIQCQHCALFDIIKIHSTRGFPMMGAAMLKCHRFVQSLWGAGMCTRGSQAQPLSYITNVYKAPEYSTKNVAQVTGQHNYVS